MVPLRENVLAQSIDAPRMPTALVTALVASTAVLLVLGDGNITLAFVPLAALVAAYTLRRVSLRNVMLALLALGLLVDNPASRPFTDQWRSLLSPIGEYLYGNLNNRTGIQVLRFSGLDVLIVLLLLLVGARAVMRRPARGEGWPAQANALILALAVSFATVVWLEAWGLARGGDFKNSLWQVRQLLWLPVLTALFACALRSRRDFLAVARIIVAAACVKVALGAYFVFAVMRPRGVHPLHATTHDDTVLFVAAIAICVAAWAHRPSRGHLALNALVVPWILLGLQINQRRIAYVSLACALFVVYVLLHGPVKRVLTRGALLVAPLFVMYLLVGQHRPYGVFAPAAKIMSVIRQNDASSSTRDIENYNLIQTLKRGRVLGSGFGHKYLEISKAYDISAVFAQYRFIAHNSVLWLWSIAGVVGFTALWMFLPIAVFLATRSYYHARTPFERTAGAVVVATIIIWMLQAWGDMGSQSWPGNLLLASVLAVAGRLAVITGAWPQGVALLRGPRAARALASATTVPEGAL
jgi:hypothetical protein